jgi:glycosyltransferase involved in cell wall biosynthesis
VAGPLRKAQLITGRYVHPLYREQLRSLPPGWSYAFTHPSLNDASAPTKRVVEQSERLSAVKAAAERVALRLLPAGGYVHRIAARPLPGAEIIHSCERLIRRAQLPYVVDVEHAALFTLYQQAALERPWARAAIERALLDERLRFVLPWSDAARRSVLAVVTPEVGRRIESKLNVVSPAIRPAADRPRERRDGPLRVLFIGTHFLEKGGVEAAAAIEEARRTHDVSLDILTYAPAPYEERLARQPGVTLHKPGGADVVQRLYERTDVLLFPSHMDTFGYVVMEACAHAQPVLAPRHLALTETIADEETGLLFPPENMLWDDDTRCRFRHTLPVPDHYLESLARPSAGYVRGIAETLARLAEDRDLYARLSAGALASVMTGPLSVARRQQLLGSIYAATASGRELEPAPEAQLVS